MTFVYCLITELFCFSFHFHSQILWSPRSFVKTSKHPSKWGKRERALKERQQDSASNWKGDRIVWSWLWLHICNICLWGWAIKYDLLWQMSLASVRKVRARAGRRAADGGCVGVLYAGSPASLQSSGLRALARHCNCSNTGWRLDRGWARHLLSTLIPDCQNTIVVIRCPVVLWEAVYVVNYSDQGLSLAMKIV